MANSRKSAKKPGTIAQFPQPESAVGVEEVPQEFQEPAEAAAQAPPAPPRNPLRKKDPRLPQTGDFFQRVAAIKQAEWDSQRIYLYLYILEPLVNLKQSGGKSYLNRYSQPVRDEHQIAVEHGSGRYRMMLAYNKVSPDESTEIARHEFEIYNIQYPPKVPKAAWINDPRNAKWEALLPKETPATPATAASTIVDAMKMVSDIRKDVRDEIGEPEEQPRTSEILETMKLAKELFAPATATASTDKPADPFDTASKIMAMRANDPMTAVMMTLLTNANAATEAAREREFKLQQQLLESKNAPAKGLMDQLLELAAMGDKLEPLKKMFGFGNGTEAAGRAARTTGIDLLRDVLTTPQVGQGLGILLAHLPNLFASANPANLNPAQSQAPRAPIVLSQEQSDGTIPAQEDPEARLLRIANTITQPMLFEFFLKDENNGEAFAQWMFDGTPKDQVFVRSYGAMELLRRYRNVPTIWPLIAPKEEEFLKFLTDFCQWDPNTEEGPVAPGNGDDGVVDLGSEGAEA